MDNVNFKKLQFLAYVASAVDELGVTALEDATAQMKIKAALGMVDEPKPYIPEPVAIVSIEEENFDLEYYNQDNYWEPGQSKAYMDFFHESVKNTGYVPIIIRPGVDTGRKKQEAFDNTVSLNRILGDTRLIYKSEWKEVKIKLQISLTKDQIVMAQNSIKTLDILREIDADRGKKGHHYPSHEERNNCTKEARHAKRTRENSIICPRDESEKCGTFTAESSLYKHLMSQHYHGAEFRCFLCSQLFTRQVTLEYHLMVHFNIVVEDCRVCGFVNRHVNHYNVHYRTVHNMTEAQIKAMEAQKKATGVKKAVSKLLELAIDCYNKDSANPPGSIYANEYDMWTKWLANAGDKPADKKANNISVKFGSAVVKTSPKAESKRTRGDSGFGPSPSSSPPSPRYRAIKREEKENIEPFSKRGRPQPQKVIVSPPPANVVAVKPEPSHVLYPSNAFSTFAPLEPTNQVHLTPRPMRPADPRRHWPGQFLTPPAPQPQVVYLNSPNVVPQVVAPPNTPVQGLTGYESYPLAGSMPRRMPPVINRPSTFNGISVSSPFHGRRMTF